MGPVPMRKGQTQHRQPTRSGKEGHRIEAIAKNELVEQDRVDGVRQIPGSRVRKGPHVQMRDKRGMQCQRWARTRTSENQNKPHNCIQTLTTKTWLQRATSG